jgi:hypothetical protein
MRGAARANIRRSWRGCNAILVELIAITVQSSTGEMDARDGESALWPWWSWSLWMLLFVVVNAHAAVACVRELEQERQRAEMRRLRCVRKRSWSDHDPSVCGASSRCAVVFSRATPTSARKRRRLVALLPRVETLRRESLACPWPIHVSFSTVDIVGDSEKLVASWLAHPLVHAAVIRLRDGLQNALHEVLVSCLSFVLCAVVVLLLRRYSTLVVGVSVDLGAFSLEV